MKNNNEKIYSENKESLYNGQARVLIMTPGECPRPMLFAAALKKMREELGTDYIDCPVPDFGCRMCYSAHQVITVGEEHYICGRVLIYRPISYGMLASIETEDIFALSRAFAAMTVTAQIEDQTYEVFWL